VSEQSETSQDEGGEQRGVTVRRVVPANGITTRQIIRAVEMTLDAHPDHAISVAVVDDARIARLHEQYMDDPEPTDVMAFDLRDDEDDPRIEGEIVVSAETARSQAQQLGLDAGQELLRYVIHGTLHLTGEDDHTPAGRRRMRRAEDRILAGLEAPPTSSSRPVKHRRTSGGV